MGPAFESQPDHKKKVITQNIGYDLFYFKNPINSAAIYFWRTMNKTRCHWCNENNPIYVKYHDEEWSVPVHNDGKLFELLLLETFQAGLSWECVLNKREAFREAFDQFDYHIIANYDESKLESLAQDKRIIRNRKKIKYAKFNAQAFMKIQHDFGSFDKYIWQFTGGCSIYEYGKSTSPLSDLISKELQKYGMRFVGSTIIYSYLQAIGIIHSHDAECFLSNGNGN